MTRFAEMCGFHSYILLAPRRTCISTYPGPAANIINISKKKIIIIIYSSISKNLSEFKLSFLTNIILISAKFTI